jgi:hypothetical protein
MNNTRGHVILWLPLGQGPLSSLLAREMEDLL